MPEAARRLPGPVAAPPAAPLRPRPTIYADHLWERPIAPARRRRGWRWYAREILTLIVLASVIGVVVTVLWSAG